MPLLNIIQLDANLLLLKNTPLLNPDEKIQKLVQALEGVNPPVKLVLGTHYQDKNAIQITLEHRKNCQSITNPLLEVIGSFYDAPISSFLANLDSSVFGPAVLLRRAQ